MIIEAILWICTAIGSKGSTITTTANNEQEARDILRWACNADNQECGAISCRQELHTSRDTKNCHIVIPQGHLTGGQSCFPGEVMTGFVVMGSTNYLSCSTPEVNCD